MNERMISIILLRDSEIVFWFWQIIDTKDFRLFEYITFCG